MIASRFREADILYQLGAGGPAAERLSRLTDVSIAASQRLGAFCRLAEIACDAGDLDRARRHLNEMHRIVEALSDGVAPADRAELNFATARYAFSCRDGAELERRAHDARASAKNANGNDRVASLATRINAYLGVDRYHRRDLGGASEAAAASTRLLREAPAALPFVKTHALTTRAVIDLHDPARAHAATGENIEALELALANGMTATAQDALFNIVNLWLYCDGYDTSPYEVKIVRESLDDAIVAPLSSEDPVLAALSLCSYGRYAEAARVLERVATPSREKGSDWLPIFFEPVTATKRARILFKAGDFVRAERAASEAFKAWERSQLGGQGTALRVRAEALEALGDVHAATAAIEDAIGALEPIQPLHHMVGAYQCAYRLTKKQTYQDSARDLVRALKKAPQPATRLTPREREIALLVAQGHSNKDIATQLNLSPRTVENRVASVFAQLSIRARWQLTPDLLSSHAAE